MKNNNCKKIDIDNKNNKKKKLTIIIELLKLLELRGERCSGLRGLSGGS